MNQEDIAKKYNINLAKLEKEQEKLAKQLEIKDSMDFSVAEKIAAIDNVFFKNKIVSGCVIVDRDMEILGQEYSSGKVRFPYISGFRAYRELPTMVEAFAKLEEKPDVVFVQGHGILHPLLGLASHFSISAQVASIGIANSLLAGKTKGGDILVGKKKSGKILVSKPGSKPMYVSPGNLISIETAYDLAKEFVRLPHKLPEPLHLAHKYAREIRRELFS